MGTVQLLDVSGVDRTSLVIQKESAMIPKSMIVAEVMTLHALGLLLFAPRNRVVACRAIHAAMLDRQCVVTVAWDVAWGDMEVFALIRRIRFVVQIATMCGRVP